MRVLVCGDRRWTNKEAIRRELEGFPPGTVIIHGAARGADSLGGEVAQELGFEVDVYPANWEVHGRAAGPIRNNVMLVQGCPDLVLAFHEDIDTSKGTADMVKRARKAGVPTKVFTE